MAILAALIANANRDPKRRPQPFEAREFMPVFAERADQTPEEMEDFAAALVAASGGEDLRLVGPDGRPLRRG